MAKLQLHVSQAYWDAHFPAVLADIRAQLGPDTHWTEDLIRWAATWSLQMAPAAELSRKFWITCALDTVNPIQMAVTTVQFADGPYIRLEVDYPGQFPEPP